MMHKVDSLLAGGASGPQIWDAMTSMRIQELVTNTDFRKTYLENWRLAGVTAVGYSLFKFRHPYTFDSIIEDIGDLTYMLDSLSDVFVKVIKAEDIRGAKAQGKHGFIMFVENTDQFGNNLENIDLFYKFGLEKREDTSVSQFVHIS